MHKLYACKSLIRLNKEYLVNCYWFCVDRTKGVLPYQQLISEYAPNIEEINVIEDAVNELLSSDETELLKSYLETIGLELETKKVALPVNRNYVGFGRISLGGGVGNIDLSKIGGYSLPFKIIGFYDSNDSLYCPVE